MPKPDSREMARRGRLGALATASRYEGLALTEKARTAFRQGFVDQAIAEAAARGEAISQPEAARRGELLRRLWYGRLALRSVRARSRRGPKAAA